MRRGGFRRGAMRRGGFRGSFRRPIGRFWGRPYKPFGWWRRPFWWYPLWWRPLYWMPWTMMMGGFIFLLYDTLAYKLYREDVNRIEQATGIPAQELSEEELVAAMKRLGIQRLEITPEDKSTASQSTKRRERYCIYCGGSVSSNAVYCSRCGRKIDAR